MARCHRTVLAYWKFESISLQRRVACELDQGQIRLLGSTTAVFAGIVVGAFRDRESEFQVEGAKAFLAVLIPMATLVMVLPNYLGFCSRTPAGASCAPNAGRTMRT